MQKVKLNKRLMASREKDGEMQFLMTGTECYMDDNRAKFHAGMGEVELIDDKPKRKSKAKPAADAGGEDAGEPAEPDI